MKHGDLLSRLALVGLLAIPLAAQTRGYAKFGPAGETIGLFNLLKQPGTCGQWRTYSGTVGETRLSIRNRTMTYRFALRTNSAAVTFDFTLDRDEIPTGDVEDLLGRKQRVTVRACRQQSRTWTADEITRSVNDPALNTKKEKQK